MRIVFMGSPEFALPSLRACIASHQVVLAVAQPDKPAGRGKELTRPPVALAADAAGIEVYQPRSARPPEVAERLRATGAELAVVVAYGKILPKGVLEAFPRGCVNVHGSLLPAYRGAAPVQWAILKGERETGVTIMKLDEGMDTGPMLLKRRLAIGEDETAGELAVRLAAVGAEALVEALAAIEAGTAVEEAQDSARASYAPMLEKAHGQVDWTRSAEEVRNLVRGVDPWPGATTTLGGEPLKLFGARRAEGQGEPGTLISIGSDGAVIAAGDGAVLIAELQAAGKRRMSAAELARGRHLAPGVRLGT
ncbi:MAG TPA: methionyl-tRNA formyltransferase [Kofleriaceae bacterium]|nr:methionyl-tRNA formyltransferase [Kofleriaceae bacterium]